MEIKKYRMIILLVYLLFLTGCKTNYNLEISNNNISENINIYVDKNYKLPSDYDGEIPDSLFKNDYYALNNNSKSDLYIKTITEENNYDKINLTYDYSIDEYIDASIFDLCFESAYLEHDNNRLIIKIDKAFKCLYLNDEIEVNIKTKNKVINNNANKKQILNNNYIWAINEENANDLNIQMIIDLNSQNDTIKNIIKIIAIIILVVVCFYFLKKSKKTNQ